MENKIFYMVDVDIYKENYGVVETIKSDLFRSKSLKEVTGFAKEYAKYMSHFDFQYLRKKEGDCYQMTIRKYYTEPTEKENGEWDDWDVINIPTPKYIKGKGILVGTYNEADIVNGKNKEDAQKISKATGYVYTNTELVTKNGKIVGLKIYVCDVQDCECFVGKLK